MSLHEELQGLDPQRLGTALGTIHGKTMLEPGGKGDVDSALADRYTALSVAAYALTEVFMKGVLPIDDKRMQDFRAGALTLARVLGEYAQLEVMDVDFPDAPNPE